LFGSTCTAMGLVLQKYGMPADESSSSSFSYCRQPWWIAGFSVWLAAQFINFIAMALAPQAVLSCLGSWSLACNILFARWILGEVMGFRKTICVCGLVFAVTLVILGAPAPGEDEENVVDVRSLSLGFVRWDFDLLATMLVCSVLFLHGTRKACGPKDSAVPPMLRQDSNDSNRSFSGRMSSRHIAELARDAVDPAAWAATAAVASGFTALLFKCIAEVLAATGHAPWWQCWQTYAILAAAVTCAPAEIHMLNLALRAGQAVVVVPAYFALGMLAQLSTGAVFFQEYMNFRTRTQELTFSVGVASALVFVALINLDRQREQQPDPELPLEDDNTVIATAGRAHTPEKRASTPEKRDTSGNSNFRGSSSRFPELLKPEAILDQRGLSLESENALTQCLLKT